MHVWPAICTISMFWSTHSVVMGSPYTTPAHLPCGASHTMLLALAEKWLHSVEWSAHIVWCIWSLHVQPEICMTYHMHHVDALTLKHPHSSGVLSLNHTTPSALQRWQHQADSGWNMMAPWYSNGWFAHGVMHLRLVYATRGMCDLPHASYQCFEICMHQWWAFLTL